jgi:hypothetical protein
MAAFVGPLLVLVAATAKLYPVFALPAFVATRSRVAARTAVVCAAAFGVYCAVNLRDIAHVAAIAPQGELFSYGARILPAHLYHQFGADRWAGPPLVKQLAALVLVGGVTIVMAAWVQRRQTLRDRPPMDSTASLMALHMGALVYLGTFATVNSFDYRLVFLLLPLPQLCAWARMPTHRLSSLAALTLAAIVVQLWIGSLSEWLHLWDELASWAVAGLLASLLVATLPPPRLLGASVFGRRSPATS